MKFYCSSEFQIVDLGKDAERVVCADYDENLSSLKLIVAGLLAPVSIQGQMAIAIWRHLCEVCDREKSSGSCIQVD